MNKKKSVSDKPRAVRPQRAYQPALTLRTKVPTFSEPPPATASTTEDPSDRSKTAASRPPPRRDSARARPSDVRRESRWDMPRARTPETRQATRKVPSTVARPDDAGKTARIDARVVPRLLISPRQILKLRLDHRAGFILSNIDGRTNVATLVELASITRKEVDAILRQLVAAGAISLGPD